MSFFQEEKKRRWPYVVVIFFILLLGGAGFAWMRLNQIMKVAEKSIVSNPKTTIKEKRSEQSLQDIFPALLGFDSPRTYLFLFLNNTELRPGGGFIGSYAVVRVAGGKMEEMKVDGSETLDRQAPKEWFVEPPKPIKKYLGVERWYFRDSNWSPDFSENVQKAIAFYQGEKGVMSSDIDTVIAVTPTVLEELLRITGPITVNSQTFDADNVTEKLEYEVEYGYKDRGVDFTDRKEIIEPLFKAIFSKAARNFLRYSSSFLDAVEKLGRSKQILAFSRDSILADFFENKDWTGRVVDIAPDTDYLLWVDANMAALKTDHAVKRDLSYSFENKKENGLLATASMTYNHGGQFDWRTSRYMTYARIYVPLESVLMSVKIIDENGREMPSQQIDSGKELGRQWFGAFISIEPKHKKTLQFSYQLPKKIQEQIEKNEYKLLIQKQAGVVNAGLTLSLNFGKTISTAAPGENKEKWGDNRYELTIDLNEDREFYVTMK